jgi:hypothetical protein
VTILSQITKNDEESKQARLDHLEDGGKRRERIEEERNLIQRIKEEKVAYLGDLNIDEKYRVELKCHKISF